MKDLVSAKSEFDILNIKNIVKLINARIKGKLVISTKIKNHLKINIDNKNLKTFNICRPGKPEDFSEFEQKGIALDIANVLLNFKKYELQFFDLPNLKDDGIEECKIIKNNICVRVWYYSSIFNAAAFTIIDFAFNIKKLSKKKKGEKK